jgi:hypothetical protein
MKNQKVTICSIALLGLLFYSKLGDKPKEPKPPRPKPSIGFYVTSPVCFNSILTSFC